MTDKHTPTADEQPGTDDGQQGEDAERPTVLVPLEVLEGESMPDGTSELLANARVILLGYHVIPEQTAAEQAREQFGETAMKKLDEFADRLTAAGAAVETRLVFTHEEQATINRIIYEHDCLAVLVPNSIDDPESVLVAVRGTVGVERTTQLVAGLFAGTDVGVTLYHILGPEENEGDAETLLNGVQTDLVERGMKSEAVATRIEQTETPIDAIARVGKEHDAVVMGETDPSVTTFVFGMPSKQVSERFLGPVLVVQRERSGDGDEAN